jgi:hypothetical protein
MCVAMCVAMMAAERKRVRNGWGRPSNQGGETGSTYLRKSVPGRVNGTCKGPEAGA